MRVEHADRVSIGHAPFGRVLRVYVDVRLAALQADHQRIVAPHAMNAVPRMPLQETQRVLLRGQRRTVGGQSLAFLQEPVVIDVELLATRQRVIRLLVIHTANQRIHIG